jgi:hypothetical protein
MCPGIEIEAKNKRKHRSEVILDGVCTLFSSTIESSQVREFGRRLKNSL